MLSGIQLFLLQYPSVCEYILLYPLPGLLRGEQNKEFCFRHGDFEMAIRILMEMLGSWVEIEVCRRVLK